MFLPGAILIDFYIFVFTLFVTIRLHDQLPAIIYLIFPFGAVNVGTVIVIVFTQLGMIRKVSAEFIEDTVIIGKTCGLRKSELQQLARMKIQVGFFGSVSLNTWVDIFNEVINYLLLMLELF